MTRTRPSADTLRQQTWLLGPSAAAGVGLVPEILRRISVPDRNQRIFQSHVAAIEEAKRNRGITLAVGFAVSQDLAKGDLVRVGPVGSPALHAEGTWTTLVLGDRGAVSSAAAELTRFVSTPRAIQAMMRGSGVTVGRFQPSVHVTLWS